MNSLKSIIAGARLEPRATPVEVSAFEERHRIALPQEYRSFVLDVANGGAFGPEYGLLPLSRTPEHWRSLHNYNEHLARPFPLEREWVWEDEPDHPSLSARVQAVDDGVLLLGEEGCGARWVLVVRGNSFGDVWLCTGEGATPSTPIASFAGWLQQRVTLGFQWWSQLPATWGTKPGIWFAAHAIKQAFVLDLERRGRPSPSLSQSSPLCLDCREFLARSAQHYKASFKVTAPGGTWHFFTDGTVTQE